MKYRVIWHAAAFRRLRRAWIAAKEPDAALKAFDELEEILGTDAHLKGESRDEARRILLVPPIGIIFRVKQELGEVLVLDAWMFSR